MKKRQIRETYKHVVHVDSDLDKIWISVRNHQSKIISEMLKDRLVVIDYLIANIMIVRFHLCFRSKKTLLISLPSALHVDCALH